MLHSRDTAGIVPSACRKSCGSALYCLKRIPPLGVVRIPYRGRVFEFWSDKCFVCKGFGVLRCDAESSAEEVECSGGVTYYVGCVGAPS